METRKERCVKNMSLRTKLFLGFGLIVVLLIQNGVFAMFQLNQIGEILSKAPPAVAADAVQRSLDQSKIIILMMTAVGLLLAIVLTFFITRSIFAPLARICKSMADALDGMGDPSEKEKLGALVEELRRILGSSG